MNKCGAYPYRATHLRSYCPDLAVSAEPRQVFGRQLGETSPGAIVQEPSTPASAPASTSASTAACWLAAD